MNKLPPFSQLSKLLLVLIFILLTPLIPTSLRPPFLYFLFNILVVVLGIESGLLKAVTSPHEEKKPSLIARNMSSLHLSIPNTTSFMTKTHSIASIASQAIAKPMERAKPVEKAKGETTLGGIIGINKLKKCASKPSIFFIGGLESEHENCNKLDSKEEKEKVEEKEIEWMEVEEMTKQELFAKAESFIGNFYRQLKMQREESWKKIHGLYHKAF